MIALSGQVSTWPNGSWWGRLLSPTLELAPDEALFVFRRGHLALTRVELSGSEPKQVLLSGDEEALVLRRDFGVRLSMPCSFAGGVAGEVEADVRLRVLAGAAEWPRQLPSEREGFPSDAGRHDPAGRSGVCEERGRRGDPMAPERTPEAFLSELIGHLFAADLARVLADQPYAGLPLRLHDPGLVGQVESAIRAGLSRPAEEGILALRGVDLLRIEAPLEDERQRRSNEAESREDFQDRMAALEERRLARERRLKELQAPQHQEVRWRLFEAGDLRAPGAQPPRLRLESSERRAALTSGQHVQILVRPSQPSYVYVLALGPYFAGGNNAVEYRWTRLFGNGGATDLLERPPRPGGNRLAGDDVLVFPGDAGASELFQHYLTFDSAPGQELLVVGLTGRPIPEEALARGLRVSELPLDAAFQDRLEAGLKATFGADSRLYTFQLSHA